MNDKDIQTFAKLFVRGSNTKTTEQISREPIELKSDTVHNNDGLFERFNIVECSLEEIETDLVQKLTSFISSVNEIREKDMNFSKAQIAEQKRQDKLVKQLKKTLK